MHPKLGLSEEVHGVISGSGEILSFQHPRGFLIVGEWMNLTICPLRGQGYDSSVGEWMYLTVCPLRGQGYDRSVGELMYLTVCPLSGQGYGRSVGEWMNPTVCPLSGQGYGRSVGEWMNPTVCPRYPLIGTTQPVDIKEKSQTPTMDRRWLKKPKLMGVFTFSMA